MTKQIPAFSLLLIILVVGCRQGEPVATPEQGSANRLDDSSSSENAIGQQNIDLTTPTGAIRTFMIAMLKLDRNSLEASTTNVEAGGLDVLLGSPPPPNAVVQSAILQINEIQFAELKAGDKWGVPGGNTQNLLTEKHFSDGRKMFRTDEASPPFVVYKVGEQWKVDPSVIILIRKKFNQ